MTVSSNNMTFNTTSPTEEAADGVPLSIMRIQSTIASVGIISNFTVIVSFLNHKIMMKKIPNKFIMNQVSNLFMKLVCFYFKSSLEMQ